MAVLCYQGGLCLPPGNAVPAPADAGAFKKTTDDKRPVSP